MRQARRPMWIGIAALSVGVLVAGSVVFRQDSGGGSGAAQQLGTVPIVASASSYVVVSAAGDDDNAGTPSSPVRTFRRGLAVVRPGQTLVVRGGTYRERIIGLDIASASADTPIRVIAYPGERVVVRGVLWLNDPDWWSFEGINVTWDADRNRSSEHMLKFSGGTNWSFRDAEVWGARSYAAILVTGGADQWELGGLEVHDTADVHADNQDHLIYVNGPVSAGVIERSVLYRSPNGRAVKVGGSVSGLVVRYNTMYDNRGPSNVQLSGAVRGSRIYYNILVRSGAGEANVRTYELSGGDNLAARNVGWESTEVVQTASGLTEDRNVMLDPRFVNPAEGDFTPSNASAAPYGHLAP